MHCTDGQVSCIHGHGDLRKTAPAMGRSAQRALGFTRTLLHQRFCCFCTNAPSKASVHTALLPGQAQEQCPLYCPGKLRSDARNRRTPPCLQRQNPGSHAARHAPSACRGQGCAGGRAHIGEAAGEELDGVLALLPRIGHMEDHHRRQLEPADLRGARRASVAPPAQPACSQPLRPALLTCIHDLVYALSVSTCWAAACCRSTHENAVPGRRARSWTLAPVVTSHEFPLHACFRPRLRLIPCAKRAPPSRTGAAWAERRSAPGGWGRTRAAACCASPFPATALPVMHCDPHSSLRTAAALLPCALRPALPTCAQQPAAQAYESYCQALPYL